MANCPRCGAQVDRTDRFCRACGTELVMIPTSSPGMEASGQAKQKKKGLFAVIAAANILLAGGLAFFMANKGCSSVEGSLVANGGSLGSFTFTPEQCRSGQRMSFFGAALLGKDRNSGGVLVIEDAVRGKLLKVEVPGTCRPPDYEECKVVEITPDQCKTFRLSVRRTSTVVNDVRLVEGSLKLDCSFKRGTVKADLKFSGCD
jgi:hypothetical protein